MGTGGRTPRATCFSLPAPAPLPLLTPPKGTPTMATGQHGRRETAMRITWKRPPWDRGGLRTYLVIIALIAGRGDYRAVLWGLLLFLPGMVLHVYAKGCLRQNQVVSRGGPYRFVRHPFYSANSLIDMGIAIMSGSVAADSTPPGVVARRVRAGDGTGGANAQHAVPRHLPRVSAPTAPVAAIPPAAATGGRALLLAEPEHRRRHRHPPPAPAAGLSVAVPARPAHPGGGDVAADGGRMLPAVDRGRADHALRTVPHAGPPYQAPAADPATVGAARRSGRCSLSRSCWWSSGSALSS